MKSYVCRSGHELFFENIQCAAGGAEVGWCPACQRLSGLLDGPDKTFQCGHPDCHSSLVKCHNYQVEHVCNRCLLADSNEYSDFQLCDYCRFNDTIPDLSIEGNRERWYRLETAKRRLLYTLDWLGLPYGIVEDGFDPALSFDFKADESSSGRQWKAMGDHEQVMTGHAQGKITINLREAEDVERENCV